MQHPRKFGRLLREHRERRKISLGEFAERCKIDVGNYSRIELGQRRPPERPIVVRMCQSMGPDFGGLDILELLAAAESERYSSHSESELLDLDQYRQAAAGERRRGPRILLRPTDSVPEKLRSIGRVRNPSVTVSNDLEAIEQVTRICRERGWRLIRILTPNGTWEEVFPQSKTSARRHGKSD